MDKLCTIGDSLICNFGVILQNKTVAGAVS